MATCPALPYFAPPETLPAPLPRVANILASKRIISRAQSTVVHINNHYLVKYGPKTRLQEGQNMLFVRQATNIPVPTVYALFHDKPSGYNFIVQEYISGQDVKECWSSLNGDEKEAIVGQLRRYLDILRNLQLPAPGYFGGVWRQPILDFLLSGAMDAGSHPDEGPCDTEQEWVDIMLRVALGAGTSTRPPTYLDWLKHIFHSFFRGHDSVFTHGDLTRGNIRLRDDGMVVLIDWQYSGWYPSYWEYCLALLYDPQEDDWSSWVPRFLDEHVAELGWMLHFRAWVLFGDI